MTEVIKDITFYKISYFLFSQDEKILALISQKGERERRHRKSRFKHVLAWQKERDDNDRLNAEKDRNHRMNVELMREEDRQIVQMKKAGFVRFILLPLFGDFNFTNSKHYCYWTFKTHTLARKYHFQCDSTKIMLFPDLMQTCQHIRELIM